MKSFQLRAISLGSGNLGPLDLSPLLSADLMPVDMGKVGPEMVACQGLVSTFIDAQQQFNSRTKTLQDELQSHKEHINTLKRELTAACKREMDEQVNRKTGYENN